MYWVTKKSRCAIPSLFYPLWVALFCSSCFGLNASKTTATSTPTTSTQTTSGSGGSSGGSTSTVVSSLSDSTAANFQEGTSSGLAWSTAVSGLTEKAITEFPSGFNTSGLILHYSFEDADDATLFADSSPSSSTLSHLLTCVGSGCVGRTTSYNRGKAISTNSALARYLQLDTSHSLAGLPSGSSSLSVCAWALYDDSNSDRFRMIFAYGNGIDGSTSNQAIVLGADYASLVGGEFYNRTLASSFWVANQWQYACMTYDGTAIKLYGNGVLLTTENRTLNLQPGDLRIGAQLSAYGGYWHGGIDEVTFWNRDLSSTEIQTLYDFSKRSSTFSFISRVMNFGTNLTTGTFSIKAPLPYGKPLPDHQVNESGFSQGVDMSQNVLLYHLDESTGTLAESSGATGATAICTGSACPTLGATGLFGKAASFSDGVSGQFLDVSATSDSSHAIPSGTHAFSYCSWATMDASRSYQWILTVGKAETVAQAAAIGARGTQLLAGLHHSVGLSVDNFWQVGVWNHVCLTYDGASTNGYLKLYGNGVLKQSTQFTPDILLDKTYIGASRALGYDGEFWNGSIDEVAIWTKELLPTEIRNLYLRGAIKLKAQGRICTETNCSGVSFAGTDGTSATSFDLTNFTQLTSGFSLAWPSAFSSIFSGFYFQYKLAIDFNSTVAGTPDSPVITEVKLQR